MTYLTQLPIFTFVKSENINPVKDGSKNGIQLNAIGKYTFRTGNTAFFVFILRNNTENKYEYIIVDKNTLLSRLNQRHYIDENTLHIRIWHTADNEIVETHGIGFEYEFMGLWMDKDRDFSGFCKGFNLIE